MTLEWIAATLNPKDVAPHPNFSTNAPSPEALFALLVQMRISDFDRLRNKDTESRLASTSSPLVDEDDVKDAIVDAARTAINAETTVMGASRLRDLGLSQDLDLGCAVAAILFSSVFLAEQDNHDVLFSGLYEIRRRLRDVDPRSRPDVQLLKAVVSQQIAFRRLEVGEQGAGEAKEALDALAGLDADNLMPPGGLAEDPRKPTNTLGLVLDELYAVADAHVANEEMREDRSSVAWQRIVTRPAPYLGLLEDRTASRSLERYLHEVFERITRSSTTTYLADPVDNPIYAGLIHCELYGNAPHAVRWRSVLGRLRLLRAGTIEDDSRLWLRTEAIRLLRHSDDTKSLELALRYTRSDGPLEAIRLDAQQIVRHRLERSRLRRVELAVLNAAAHLLGRDEASKALRAVMECITDGLATRAWRWEERSVQLESAWTAAVNLAGPGEMLDDVACRLLAAAKDVSEGEQLVVGALTRAALAIEWDGVADETRGAWARWLEDSTSSVAVAMAESVGPRIGLEPQVGSETRSIIAQAAALVNRYIRTEVLPTPAEMTGYAEEIANDLEERRRAAVQGTYLRSSVSTCEIAVGFAQYFDVGSLWDPIVSFLVDPKVGRHEKASTLERLARWRGEVPSDVVSRLGDNLQTLLAQVSSDPFDSGIVPFPEAIRLGARYGLIDDVDLLNLIASLGGMEETAQRVEAARTLSLILQTREVEDWMFVVVLQLTHDMEALVRAEAGRAAACVLGRSSKYRQAMGDRLRDLLSQDGLVVPVLVLRGLQDDAVIRADIPDELIAKVRQLAQSHPARGVRLQAEAMLMAAELQ